MGGGKESVYLLGIPQNNPATTPPNLCRYDACIVLSSEEQTRVCWPADSTSFAQLTIPRRMFNERGMTFFSALQRNGFQVEDKPVIERYTGELTATELCEICVPIKGV